MPLFETVSYHLSQSLAEHTRLEISRILDSNGANSVSIDLATHILSDTIEFEGCDNRNLRTSVACVTPYWVERSMELGHLQDPKYFSADKDMFFSGIVATSADLPLGDKEVIASGILAQGGAWREGLTRDVSHLFVTNTRSEKYLTAMHFRDSAHITIVLPQWFDQCWSTQMRLPSDVFQFPDPPYLRGDHDIAAYKVQMLLKKSEVGRPRLKSGFDKQAMYGTMQVVDTATPLAMRKSNIWEGRSIMLSPSLELDSQRRESVESRIRRAGGVVVNARQENETVMVEQTDIFITRFRTGAAYAKALAGGKTVGTLAWLFYVERTGVMSRPRDQLLHYPVQSMPIHGFSDHEITVTNYQGDAREYLKKLIEVMGAKFTPTMSGRNTIVIAAYKSGNKTAKAEEWSVPVVTHKWLEDCFVEWRNLTPAQKKYLDYAPGVNYGTVLGDRGVGRVGLEEDLELLPVIVEEPAPRTYQPTHPNSGDVENPEGETGAGERIIGTATSVREALEVDEVEDVLHISGDAEENCGDVRKDPLHSPTKFGPPRGIKKAQLEMKTIDATELLSSKPKSRRNSTSSATVKAAGTTLISMNKAPGPPDGGSDPKLPAAEPALAKGMASTMKVGPPVKSKPKPKPKSISSTKPTSQCDDEIVVVEAPTKDPTSDPPRRNEEHSTSGTIQVIKSGTISKAKPNMVGTRLLAGSDQESTDEVRDKRRVKGKAPAMQLDTDDQSDRDVFMVRTKPKPKPTVYKSRARITTPPHAEREVEGRNPGGVDETALRTKTKQTPRMRQVETTSRAKARRATFTSESGSDDEIIILPLKKGATDAVKKSTRKAALQPSPNRIVSVDLPDPRTMVESTHRQSSPDSVAQFGPASRRMVKSPKRASPVRVPSYEASPSSPKRGRTSAKRATVSRSSTPSRSSSRPLTSSKLAARNVIPPRTSVIPPPPTQRSPSRRTAAAAATQKLRDEVMPDVINYENERRQGTKVDLGRRWQSSQSEEDEDARDLGIRGRKRRKIANNDEDDDSKDGRGATMSRSGADDSDVPASRFVTNAKASKRPADDDEKPGPSKRNGQDGARKRVRRESISAHGSQDERKLSRSDPRKIRVLTTKVMVSEEIEKALTKLGVKFTEKPHECTHLVTNHLSRTEKFLCALPNVPFVLCMDWLKACAESRSVVAEDDYTLQDPDMEHKYKFKLAEALERARELKRNKQKLLQGHFFYITPGVQSNYSILKNVLRALGAECRATVPTIRNFSDTRHIISSLKDKSLWRPLVKHGVAIYSHELILSAAFTQFVDWDGEDKILAQGD